MEPVHIIALSLIVLILILSFFLIKFRRKTSPVNQAHLEYIAGLNHMINNEYDKALEHLRKTVRLNTDLLDAYIKIGDILRHQGNPDQAVKIHRDLLVRENMSNHIRTSVLESLVLDYRAANSWPQAVHTCEQILDMQKTSPWATTMLQEIYEDMGDWRNAFQHLKRTSPLSKSAKNTQLANYKVKESLGLINLGKEHEARLCCREAIKLDKCNVGAYLELADSYIREKRLKDALIALRQLIQANPDRASLAFTRLKNVLFDLGQYSEIEKMYVELMKTNPDVIEAYIGLAELLEKKGEYLKAVDICKNALDKDPNRIELNLLLIRLRSKLGMKEQAINLAENLAKTIAAEHHNYMCTECKYESDDYFWHCPKCKAWNSAKRMKIAYT